MLTVEFVWLLLVCLGFTKFLVHAQDQTDFISIDCGATGAYSDQTTKLDYVPDDGYIDTGVSKEIKSDYKTNSATRFWNVRSFPEGTKNCYDLTGLKIEDTTKYLVRAQFMYGNYDSKNQLPKFDIYLGVDYWDTVIFPVTANASSIIPLEMIYTPSSNFTYVCLVNTGEGTPFISVLELRSLKLDNPAYSPPGNRTALQLSQRYDMGSAVAQYRYPDDIHDRIWTRYEDVNQGWKHLSTEKKINTDGNSFGPPEIIMNTAVSPTFSSGNITILWKTNSPTDKYYFSFYFCDFQVMQSPQSREIQIYVNDTASGNPFKPPYLTALTQQYAPVASSEDWLNIAILSTSSSSFGPILNAFEVYIIKELTQVETDSGDVEAMKNIKTAYRLTKNWQGDPCLPQQYSWEGLNCVNNSQGSPTVTSLNLSSRGLSGEISSSISGLTSLENLDLSHNNLKGPIPDFLSQMTSLKVLNLKGNKLTGTIPAGLLNRYDQQTMSLSVEGNPDLCYPDPCKKAKKKNNIVIALAAASGSLIIALAIIFWRIRSKKWGKAKGYRTLSKSGRKRFSYSEVLKMTNKFDTKEIVGDGGFGAVYRGCLNGSDVAVKKLHPSSAKGYKDFHSEAEKLTNVNHKNLTSLLGYCQEGEKLCLINEFMAKGDLGKYLTAQNQETLTWKSRLSIALDTAHGLEYLHNQCKPPIIHRGIKPANILLDEELHAKLADFGLSRNLLNEISNSEAGTSEYRDPYEHLGGLSNKIDVYAFGLVLLEIISGQPVTHITQWVKTSEGCKKRTIDPKVGKNFDRDSARIAFDVALDCILEDPNERPDMKVVVTRLDTCLNMETARNKDGSGTQSTVDAEEPSQNEDTRVRPRKV